MPAVSPYMTVQQCGNPVAVGVGFGPNVFPPAGGANGRLNLSHALQNSLIKASSP